MRKVTGEADLHICPKLLYYIISCSEAIRNFVKVAWLSLGFNKGATASGWHPKTNPLSYYHTPLTSIAFF